MLWTKSNDNLREILIKGKGGGPKIQNSCGGAISIAPKVYGVETLGSVNLLESIDINVDTCSNHKFVRLHSY